MSVRVGLGLVLEGFIHLSYLCVILGQYSEFKFGPIFYNIMMFLLSSYVSNEDDINRCHV